MPGRQRVFLTPHQAVCAIKNDFKQYAPQTRLFLELCPLLLEGSCQVTEDSGRNCIWINSPSRRRRAMQKISPGELGNLLLSTLETRMPGIPKLAELCELVFQSPAYPGTDEDGNRRGILVETGMESFVCRQCGKCCRSLDYRFELTEDDVRMWKKLGRKDILEWVAEFRRRGRAASYAIWVTPGTREFAPVCPWLKEIAGTGKWECLIHEVKPDVCRQYPASIKHARMTGCPAFDRLP